MGRHDRDGTGRRSPGRDLLSAKTVADREPRGTNRTLAFSPLSATISTLECSEEQLTGVGLFFLDSYEQAFVSATPAQDSRSHRSAFGLVRRRTTCLRAEPSA